MSSDDLKPEKKHQDTPWLNGYILRYGYALQLPISNDDTGDRDGRQMMGDRMIQ